MVTLSTDFKVWSPHCRLLNNLFYLQYSALIHANALNFSATFVVQQYQVPEFPTGLTPLLLHVSLDPHNLGIRCLVNGETVQSSNTNQMIFKTAALIAWVSK